MQKLILCFWKEQVSHMILQCFWVFGGVLFYLFRVFFNQNGEKSKMAEKRRIIKKNDFEKN